MIRLPKRALTESREIVWDRDPALLPRPEDPEGAAAWDSALAEYGRTFRAVHLPKRPGCEPVVFVIGSLTVAQKANTMGHDFGRRVFETIAYGVHDILNLQDDEGRPVKVERESSNYGARLPLDVQALFIDEGLCVFMFAAVLAASSLPLEEAKSDRAP